MQYEKGQIETLFDRRYYAILSVLHSILVRTSSIKDGLNCQMRQCVARTMEVLREHWREGNSGDRSSGTTQIHRIPGKKGCRVCRGSGV